MLKHLFHVFHFFVKTVKIYKAKCPNSARIQTLAHESPASHAIVCVRICVPRYLPHEGKVVFNRPWFLHRSDRKVKQAILCKQDESNKGLFNYLVCTN